uniref:Rhamnosyl O-methyltransferase n=1 Tax=Neobodo designis TaxID=312471 RepID=A0A7S1Q5R9_NEODS|mmetsp:Transcript_31891/g.98688  ORF Transcript_31891/g.98688 Transcript_31891/m.98688 type:complete len:398 (+) Transcript_31891:46-1239(+)
MAGSSVGRLVVIVCLASLLVNVMQFSRNATAAYHYEEELRVLRASLAHQKQKGAAGSGVGAGGAPGAGKCPECPPCPQSEEFLKEPPEGGDDAGDQQQQQQAGLPGPQDEIGWDLGLARVPNKTKNTVYDPRNDAALQKSPKRYARSPVPKGSWRVRVGDNKWVTMDEVAFAYDVWFEENQRFSYMSWLGVYVQQDPIDAFAIQDMLWRVKPDLVIEIGTNTGGGAVFYSSVMRAYNDKAKIVTLDVVPAPRNWNKRNAHNCPNCILGPEHAYWKDGMITYIQGRVTEQSTRDKVQKFVDEAKTVLVIEDASHRYPDTLENIEASYHWVTKGSYLLVQDTKMDRFVAGLGQKYGKYKFGPMRSVDEFIAKHGDKFVIDRRFEYLLYSQHHRGWLYRK